MTHRKETRVGGVTALARAAALVSVVGLAACSGSIHETVPVVQRPGSTETAPPPTYRMYVANESSDLVSRVAFRPGQGAWVEEEIPVGIMPGDIDGAHGITVSPDGEWWVVSIAHGQPYGYLWKFAAGPDTLAARTTAGLFPATMGVSPDGQFLLAVNFNLHGDPVPSDVSVIHAPSMTEVSRVTTCVMPHGSRVDATGSRHYSVCMGSDQVVEIDLSTFEISARFSVLPGREGALALDDRGLERAAGHGSHGAQGPSDAVCAPTWVEPAVGEAAGRAVYVACNRNREILEVDVERWEVTRRFATGQAPYNLEVTPDGRTLVATLKGEQKVAFFDLDTGDELGRVPTTQPVTHGVVASPDGRYVFVTNEAVGSTPGTLDVFEVETRRRVASTDLRHQPGGIDFWRIGEGDR